MKTPKETLHAALSYKNCDGLIEEGSRLEDAVLYAMQEYASQYTPEIKMPTESLSNFKSLIEATEDYKNGWRKGVAWFRSEIIKLNPDIKIK